MTIQRPNRIKKKYLDENSVDGTKVLFSNNESFKALSADRTETELFKLNANDQLTILKIPKIDFMPVEGIDAVNKNYVDYQYTSLLNEAKIYTDAEKARATAAEAAEALARETADSALNSRILPIEKRYQVNRLSVYENNAQAYADGQPGVEDPSGQLRDGWYYTNTSAGQKINWYYFDGINNATVTLGNLSAYAVMTFDSLSSMPILSVYTKPTGSSDVMPSFAHSRVSYAASSTGLVTGKKYLVYFGENPTVHPELPRVQLAKSATSSAGSQSATEEVLTVSFGSNSGASVNSVKFMTESLGIWSSNYKHEVELRIRHASQLSLSSEITNRIADVNAEETRAMAAEAAEATLRASEDTRILSESKAYTDAEKARALAAETAEAALRASEDARILSESKTYTNSEISSLINAAPEAYNTLKEIADYIASDQSATSQILSQLYDQDSRLDVIEGTGEGSVKKAETDSKSYTDIEVSEEAAVRAIEDIRVLSQSKTYTDSEISTQAALRASEDTRILSESKIYTDAEKARAMAAEAAEAALRASEDTRILSESKAYTDAEVSEEAAVRASEDTRVLSESKAYTDAETAIRISEDARVLSDANAYTDMKVYEEAELRISEDARILSEANAYTDSEVSEEAELRISEDVRILSESKAYTDMEISEETAIRSSEDALVLSQSKAYTDMETARAMTAEAAEAATRASEDVRILSESKTYTDMEINTHVSSKLGQQNGIATLDSFGKLYTSQLPSLAITDVYVVEYIADRDAITYQMGDVVKVTKAIQSASGEWLARTYIATDNGTWLDIVTESDVDTVNGQTGTVVLTTDDIAEGYDNKYFTDSRAQSAVVVNTLAGNEMDHAPSVSSVNSLVDSFGERIAVDSFVVTSQIIANNYIELQNKAFSMSIVPSIDRLLLLEGDDYVVSVVSGKTRLTFQNSLLQGYEEALEVGDKIKIRYLKDIR